MKSRNTSVNGYKDRFAGRVGEVARDESGVTAVEYTLIVGLISFAILLTLTAIGQVVDENVFTVIATAAGSM